MGEYAEMMLDGTCCEGCGEFMGDILDGGEAPGYPRYCSPQCEPVGFRAVVVNNGAPRDTTAARRAQRNNDARRTNAKLRKPFECGDCGKLFRTSGGKRQHRKDVHPTRSTA